MKCTVTLQPAEKVQGRDFRTQLRVSADYASPSFTQDQLATAKSATQAWHLCLQGAMLCAFCPT